MVLQKTQIRDHSLYYMSDINAFINEDIMSIENYIEMRFRILARSELERLRNIFGNRLANPIVLEEFNKTTRMEILSIIYEKERNLNLLKNDWAKVFLAGIQNFYVPIADGEGICKEILFCRRSHIEEFFEVCKVHNKMI